MQHSPTRLCRCGCGQATRIYRGKPNLCIDGHQTKGRKISRPAKPAIAHSNGYVLVRMPDHPTAHRGYVYEHVLVAERVLGKPLPERACVHHVNGVKHDNRPSNLVICPDATYHNLLHTRARALAACGHADWIRCRHCGEYGPREGMRIGGTRPSVAAHFACARADDARRRQRARERRAASEIRA